MSALKKLAGQTALYGIPSILGRFLNYFLVILHTDKLQSAEYGIYSDLYTYVAYFLMLYTFGMETTFFRFSHKENPQKAYQNAASFVFFLSSLITVLLIFSASGIANYLDYPGKQHYVIWLAVILWIDALVALPFARLRFENKPLRFATYRMVNILVVILLQIFFLAVLPGIAEGSYLAAFKPIAELIYVTDFQVEYIILANLIANTLFIIFLFKPILQIGFKLDFKILKPMLWYAIPLTITSIAGITNERVDIPMLGNFLPDGFYPGKTAQDAQGIYSASVRLSALMILGTQAFRFAAEPFFFAQSSDKQAPALFARVFKYFAICAVLVFVGVSINREFIATVLLRKPEFREALMVVPYLLAGKMLFGFYTNFAIWFKVTDKTYFGTIFTIIGALITLIFNYLFIPHLGYMAPAYASILAYFTMVCICYFYGQKHFPIPYNIKNVFTYVILGILCVILTEQLHLASKEVEFGVKIGISFVLFMLVILVEKNNLRGLQRA